MQRPIQVVQDPNDSSTDIDEYIDQNYDDNYPNYDDYPFPDSDDEYYTEEGDQEQYNNEEYNGNENENDSTTSSPLLAVESASVDLSISTPASNKGLTNWIHDMNVKNKLNKQQTTPVKKSRFSSFLSLW